jgi:hypothetical protein
MLASLRHPQEGMAEISIYLVELRIDKIDRRKAEAITLDVEI